MTGIVRTYSRRHGYGFIIPASEESTDPDRFFSHAWIKDKPGQQFMMPGQLVEFDPHEENGRPQARNVRKLDDGPQTPKAEARS
jgi:cold shock CspA family protein